MKFGNKYELFEAVTRGRVETFVAKDLVSGERVLFCIFEAPEQKPDQPTVQWVVESFGLVAPDPPGLVVETGKYKGTTYAYLVTKLVDDAGLKHWIESYESSVGDTHQIATEPVVVPTNKTPGSDDVTAEFSALGSPFVRPPEVKQSQRTSPREIAAEPAIAAPATAKRVPGDFTREFFAGSDAPSVGLPVQQTSESAVQPDPSFRSEIPANPTDHGGVSKEDHSRASLETGSSEPPPDPGFTAMFESNFKPANDESSESLGASRQPEDMKGVGFTDFFRGPFDGERPAATPAILPTVNRKEQKAPGEFTRVFGSGKGGTTASSPPPGPFQSPPQSPVRDLPRETMPSDATQSFPDAGRLAATSPPPNATTPNWGSGSSTHDEPTLERPAWNPSAAPSSKASEPSTGPIFRETSSPAHDGATRVFSVPDRGSASTPSPLSAGPSEYTRVISGITKSPLEEAPLRGGSQNKGGESAFKMPTPAFAPLPQVAAPSVPRLSPPIVGAPPFPNVPQLEIKTPQPKPSYLSLITILSVLLFIALMLVAYFAIKH
jgi:hypothetical protein